MESKRLHKSVRKSRKRSVRRRSRKLKSKSLKAGTKKHVHFETTPDIVKVRRRLRATTNAKRIPVVIPKRSPYARYLLKSPLQSLFSERQNVFL